MGDDALYITKFPDRKSVSLCRAKGNVIEVLAYFRTEAHADACYDTLNRLIMTVAPND